MRAAICDDDREFLSPFVKELEHCCQKVSLPLEIEAFDDPARLLEAHRSTPYSILFIDIEMPNINGFELAKEIHGMDPMCVIVFVSQMDFLVYQSLDYSPFAFLRKSHINEELEHVLTRLFHYFSLECKLTISYQRKPVALNGSDIMYIESVRNCVIIYLADEQYRIKESISSWERRMQKYHFVRIHASYLVNCRYIYNISKADVTLINGIQLPVSRQKLKGVKEYFAEYMEEIS